MATFKAGPKKKKITIYMEPWLYVDFCKKILDEKGDLALSEKVSELVKEYMAKPS